LSEEESTEAPFGRTEVAEGEGTADADKHCCSTLLLEKGGKTVVLDDDELLGGTEKVVVVGPAVKGKSGTGAGERGRLVSK